MTKPPTKPTAYLLLDLVDPIHFESRRLRLLKERGLPPMKIGTTTRMLVEAALDVVKDHDILLVFYYASEAEQAALQVREWVHVLGCDVRPGQVRAIPLSEFNQPQTMGRKVYIDHYRQPATERKPADDRRLFGILGEVRTVRYGPDVATTLDYDDRVLATLTRKEGERLVKVDPFRIKAAFPYPRSSTTNAPSVESVDVDHIFGPNGVPKPKAKTQKIGFADDGEDLDDLFDGLL